MSGLDPKGVYTKEAEAVESLSCPLGEIRLFFDGLPVPFALYDKPSVSSYAQQFSVDANKRLCWHYDPDGRSHILECKLEPEGVCEWDYATSECLEAVEIVDGSTVLIIATKWDYWEYDRNGGKGVEDYYVREIEHGLQFVFDESTRSHDIVVGASWLSGYTYDNRNDPWLIGDPGVDELDGL